MIPNASITTDKDIAIQTPSIPSLNGYASKYASGSFKTTFATIAEIIGGKVSPAPWNTPE